MLDARDMEPWTGRWEWNAASAQFSDPNHARLWKTQTQDVLVRDGRLVIRNAQTFVSGGSRNWTFNGAFDGTPYPITWDDDGSVMTVIAFLLIKPTTGGDAFYAPDGSFAGAEQFHFDGDKVTVHGTTWSAGKQYTYFEEWNRVG